MSQARPVVLVVDDKKNMLGLMKKVLKQDAKVLTASGGGEALRILASERVHAILCDLRMPDMDGLDVLRASKRLQPHAEFILMTAFASVGTAVEALKLGAFDYLSKPFEPDDARNLVIRALARVDWASGPEPTHEGAVLPGVVGRSTGMLELATLVEKVANSDITALVLGETGTGKERIARAIHELSPRATRRFVAVNCAAIPPELLESELFGHAKGAYTGAVSSRKGLFEEAHRGSLFLDEIGDMLPSLQAKLTRVLEERVVRRVGESDERPVDVRLIAATHRDLEGMVKTGTFREDLWYRLNVALVQIPPLRERKDDIERLAAHFLDELAERTGAGKKFKLSHGALDGLLRFDWPGNVRQLRSAIERARVVSSGDAIELADLPPEILQFEYGKEEDPELLAGTWSQATEWGRLHTGRRYLEGVLKHFDGQILEAAKHAGVERESFYRLLRKHKVDPALFRGARQPGNKE